VTGALRRVLLVLISCGTVLTLLAGPASADVLVNQPRTQVCVGHTFRVGVWYQAFSGGSRHYRVRVWNPAGRKLLDVSGRASSDAWRFWRIHPHRTGVFRTVYGFGTGVAPLTFRTRARAC
jgi:hypothetical protein